MKRSLVMQRVFLTAAFILTASIMISCSSGNKLQSQVSGTWERTQAEGTVEINLEQEPNTMKINGKIYNATIEKVDNGTFSVYLKVETTAGQMEAWTLRQIWDDNGSSFKIAFNHNGTKETLEAGSQT